MPTKEERREIAARLRETAGQIEFTGEGVEDCIFDNWWSYSAADGAKSYMRLADLIEPEERACEWVSVDDRLPDCKGEYIVAYHPCHWDYVDYDKVQVGTDSFSGKSSWAKRKYQRVTHWMPKPEPPSAKVVDDHA